MSKVYTGIELLEMMNKGKIKQHTKFKSDEFGIVEKIGFNFFNEKDENLFSLSSTWDILKQDFELIEENTIDIDSIGEYPEYFIENSTSTEDVKSLARKYNELVQAVQQLNKETQELKEKIRWKKQ